MGRTILALSMNSPDTSKNFLVSRKTYDVYRRYPYGYAKRYTLTVEIYLMQNIDYNTEVKDTFQGLRSQSLWSDNHDWFLLCGKNLG